MHKTSRNQTKASTVLQLTDSKTKQKNNEIHVDFDFVYTSNAMY